MQKIPIFQTQPVKLPYPQSTQHHPQPYKEISQHEIQRLRQRQDQEQARKQDVVHGQPGQGRGFFAGWRRKFYVVLRKIIVYWVGEFSFLFYFKSFLAEYFEKYGQIKHLVKFY